MTHTTQPDMFCKLWALILKCEQHLDEEGSIGVYTAQALKANSEKEKMLSTSEGTPQRRTGLKQSCSPRSLSAESAPSKM